MALDGLTTDFTTADPRGDARSSTADRLTAAYREWVQGEWTVVVVGDASTYAEGVRDLGIGEVSVVPA